MNLEYWFPTIISYSDWHGKCQPLIDHCYDLQKTIERGGDNWISTVYNTHSTHNIIDDEKFKEINDWALEQANLYSEKIGSKDKLKYQNGWFNIYKKKDFQEYHTHPGSTLSGILVLKANPKTAIDLSFMVLKKESTTWSANRFFCQSLIFKIDSQY